MMILQSTDYQFLRHLDSLLIFKISALNIIVILWLVPNGLSTDWYVQETVCSLRSAFNLSLKSQIFFSSDLDPEY